VQVCAYTKRLTKWVKILYRTEALVSASVWVGEVHQVTHALQPFSNLLCVPICFILSVAQYLWQSTVSYITESQLTTLGSKEMFT
jgi:hypothetical protein